jgi:Anaphase promoting complex subunit 8 / Cdc23
MGRAAEAMNSMDPDVVNGVGQFVSIDSSGKSHSGQKPSQKESDLEELDLPRYLLAKSYFDCKEYDRVAFTLTGCKSLKSKFLRLYSKFLVTTPLLS